MSSQLVDIDADGHMDILAGSFSGVPQLIKGSKTGFHDPANMMDSSGETVLIADFWNDETNEWDKTDRAKSEGHCTSVAAVKRSSALESWTSTRVHSPSAPST